MAAGKELGFSATNGRNLREAMAMATLRQVHNKGHFYVEMRKDGRRDIFFCVLCLSRCYSESALYDHLKGNIHRQRYAGAKLTLFGSNPWPFSDGVFFFHISGDKERQLLMLDSCEDRPLNSNGLIDSSSGNCSGGNAIVLSSKNCSDGNSSSRVGYVVNGQSDHLVVSGVLVDDMVSDLEVEHIGLGAIGSRIKETTNSVTRIWCAWLGTEEAADTDMLSLSFSDFGLIVFSYHYDLGRKPILNDLGGLVSSSPSPIENINGTKRIRSFSEPEDFRESVGHGSPPADCPDLTSSAEKALVLQTGSSSNALSCKPSDCQLRQSRFISRKAIRKALRRQQRIAAERMCDLCQQKMLPGKDVATLFNCSTGNIACKSRNTTGAFHVFHASCLVNWILLCQYEILQDQASNAKLSNENAFKTKKRRGPKSRKTVENNVEIPSYRTDIHVILCPECQGTGINTQGDELEKPTVPLSKMYLYKVKANEARKAWIKNPEALQMCSVGLHFPSEENCQEKVSHAKLLNFYKATNEGECLD